MASNDSMRFVSFQEHEVDSFIENEENENTERKTKCDLVLLRKAFLLKADKARELEEIAPQDLDCYLSRFMIEVKCLYNKQNNTWALGDMEIIFARPCIILSLLFIRK